MAVIKKFHPVARQAGIEVQIAKAEITASRGAFDPEWSAGNNRKEWDGTTYYNQQTTELKIPTWYGIDVYAGRENITGSRLNPEETKGTVSYIGFSVPIVQNLVMDKRRAALMQAKNLHQLSEVQRRMVINDLLQDALRTYWDWWEQYHIHLLLKAALQNAEKRLAMVKSAYLLGDRPAIDTLEAFTQVQSFQISVSGVYAEFLKAHLQLSAFLWTENGRQFELPATIIPQDFKPAKPFSLDELLHTANSHPEFTQYRYKLKGLEIEKRLRFQSLLPELRLKYNQTGYDFSKTVNAAWFDKNYRYGISFSLPLRLSEGRGEYNKAKLKIESTRLEQVNKQVQLYNKIKQYYTDWQQTIVQLNLQNNMVESVAALQKGEEIRFSNGESSLFLINSRELRTIEAQQKLIQLKSKSQKTVNNLRWAAGLFSN